MILATHLGGWTDDVASILSTATSAAQTTCSVAQGSAANMVRAGAGSVLPGSASSIVNKADGYLQQTCAVVAPQPGAAGPAPVKLSTFSLTPAQMAEIAAKGATSRTLPASAITTFNPASNAWRVAVPRGLAGLGASPYIEVQSAATKPSAANEVPAKDFDKAVGKGWWRSAWGMTAIGIGSALAAGTVGYFAVIHPSRAR